MTNSGARDGRSGGDGTFARSIPEWNAVADGKRCRFHLTISKSFKPLCVAGRELGFGMVVPAPAYVRQKGGVRGLRDVAANAFGDLIGGDWENFPICDPGFAPYDFGVESYCKFVRFAFKAYLSTYRFPDPKAPAIEATERSLHCYASVYKAMQDIHVSYHPPIPVIVCRSSMDFLWGMDRLHEMHGHFPKEIALFSPIFTTTTDGGKIDSAEGILSAIDAILRRNKVTNRTTLRAIRCTPEVALVASMFERVTAIDVMEWDAKRFDGDQPMNSDTGRSVQRMANFQKWLIAKGDWRQMYGQQYVLPNLDIVLPELR